jgi:hypothetical protein
MSPSKPVEVEDLVNELESVRERLVQERQRLLARVALIDVALGGGTLKAAPAKPRTPKAGTVAEAIRVVLAGRPGLTIRELQDACPEHAAKTVEATVRNMAACGHLTKDDQTPRHFWLPEKSTGAGELPEGSRPTKGNGTPTNGGARTQPTATAKG